MDGKPEDVLARIDQHRKVFNTDYIDSLLVHCMTRGQWTNEWKRIMDAFNEAQEKKWIRAKGVSCHSLPALRAATASNWTEVHLVRVNPQGIYTDGEVADWTSARQHAADGEEAGLHDGVHASAHAGIARHFYGVDHVEFQLLADDVLLHAAGRWSQTSSLPKGLLSRKIEPARLPSAHPRVPGN